MSSVTLKKILAEFPWFATILEDRSYRKKGFVISKLWDGTTDVHAIYLQKKDNEGVYSGFQNILESFPESGEWCYLQCRTNTNLEIVISHYQFGPSQKPLKSILQSMLALEIAKNSKVMHMVLRNGCVGTYYIWSLKDYMGKKFLPLNALINSA